MASRNMSIEYVVENYNGMPRSWVEIAEFVSSQCSDREAVDLAEALIKAEADFAKYMEDYGYEIG